MNLNLVGLDFDIKVNLNIREAAHLCMEFILYAGIHSAKQAESKLYWPVLHLKIARPYKKETSFMAGERAFSYISVSTNWRVAGEMDLLAEI